jgi:hypothetical protein
MKPTISENEFEDAEEETNSSTRYVFSVKFRGHTLVDFPCRSTKYGRSTTVLLSSIIYVSRQEEECAVSV